MHVVATAAEPEFVRLELEDQPGNRCAGVLTLELAHMQATEVFTPNRGSVQLNLMASDIETIVAALVARGIVRQPEAEEVEDGEWHAV